MTNSKPVFIVSEPNIMGFIGRYNKNFVAHMKDLCGLWDFPDGVPEKPAIILYVHGRLEKDLGYDIPLWIRGNIWNKETQACQVWNSDGTRAYDAIINMRLQEDGMRIGQYVGYITYPDEPAFYEDH